MYFSILALKLLYHKAENKIILLRNFYNEYLARYYIFNNEQKYLNSKSISSNVLFALNMFLFIIYILFTYSRV